MSWIKILNPRSSHMEFVDTCLKDYMIPIWLLNAHLHLDLISCDCLWSSCQHVTHRKCRTDSQRRKTFLQFQQACSQRIPTTSGLKCKQILWQVKMCFFANRKYAGLVLCFHASPQPLWESQRWSAPDFTSLHSRRDGNMFFSYKHFPY